MPQAIPVKAALLRAIDHIERLQNGRGHADPLFVTPLPHVDLALRIALRAAADRGQMTCVVSETLSPDGAALHLLSTRAHVSLEDLHHREIKQPELTRLVAAGARISSSPIHFALFTRSDEVADALLDLNRAHALHTVVCEKRTDTDLDGWRSDLEFVSRMTGAEVHLVAGRLPAAGRFIPGFGQRG